MRSKKNKDRWVNSKTAVYNTAYHFIWCTKFRRKVLTQEIQNRTKQLLLEKAQELECKIETMEIMDDHIHLFVKTLPIHAPHFIIRQFKGYTARILRQEYPELKKRLPTLWTRSYYVESIGHISENTVKQYIENQKNK